MLYLEINERLDKKQLMFCLAAAHLLTLGSGALFLFEKAVYLGGLYDTWSM